MEENLMSQTIFDNVQYETWIEHLTFSKEKKKIDNELVVSYRNS
mgnify:CR=1 FL=1